MNLTLWIIAGLLAAAFLASGVMKLIQPKEKVATPDFSGGAIKVIGGLEVLAAIGLILPAAVGIAPVVVPLAAAGLVLLMIGAVIVHLRRHELRTIAVPVALLALSAVVVWGRFGPQSF
ncbi:DoxX family protein [Amycolatopsis sp. GM8]|uniref:DoxX family protein n=1 Tax=Amycolatopsis sp. GM8 TaxID=2896530 RepID=UPI001F3188E2|nr:DoxX family protein [Amycolatopsis sp. GM8]